MKNKKKKFFSLGFYFWIAFVSLMVVLFFINRAIIGKAITKIKDSPSFSQPEILQGDIRQTIEGSSSNETLTSEALALDKNSKIDNETYSPTDDVENNIEEPLENIEKKEETSVQEIPEQKEIQNEPSDTSHKMRDIEVYFVSVNDNGIVTREKCVRSIEHSLSPMVDSLKALLQGPTKEEAKHGIRSFIPADTQLLSASIKDETALINLSEDFQFNRYGVEGYNIQLQQIVFTACSFPTVKSVQFLIEGQRRDFIGSEGVWIGSPLTINSF